MTGQHHEIEVWQVAAHLAEGLSDQTFDAIACDRVADLLFGDRHTETRANRFALQREDAKKPVSRTLRLGEYPPEVAWP